MNFNRQAAKAAGYSDDEIDSFLGQQKPQAPSTPIPNQLPQSPLTKIADTVMAVPKALFPAAERLGKGLGTGLAIAGTSDEDLKSREANLNAVGDLQEKAVEMLHQGKMEQAKKLLQLAKDQNKMVQDQIGERTGDIKGMESDIAKGSVGTAANFIPGAGTVGGRLASGTIQGVAQGYASSEDGQELPSMVGGGVMGAGMSAAGELVGAGVKKISQNAAKKAQVAAQAAENAGVKPSANSQAADLYASQWTVPRKIANRLNPRQTAQDLLDLGITGKTLEEQTQIANTVTGQNGSLSKFNRSMLANTPNFSTDAIAVAESAAKDAQLLKTTNPAAHKAAVDTVREMVSGLGQEGKTALDAFDVEKKLEEYGYRYINASTDLTPNPAMEELGHIYLDAAKSIGEGIDKSKVAPEIISALKTPELRQQLASISPELAKRFDAATTVSEIRALQRPFVRSAQLADVTLNNQTAPFTQAFNKVTKGSVGVNNLFGLTDVAAQKLQSPEARSSVAGAMQNVSNAKNAVMGALPNIEANPTFGNVAIGATVGNLGKAQGGVDTLPDIQDPTQQAPNGQQGTVPQTQENVANQTSQNTPQFKYTTAQLMEATQNALADGNTKAAVQLKSMLDLQMKYEKSGSTKQLSAQAQKDQTKAKTGIAAMRRIVDDLNKDPNALIMKLNPLDQSGRAMDADIKSAIDIIGYFRTGATLTPQQRKDYISMFPSAMDSTETKQQKIQAIVDELKGYAGVQSDIPQYNQTLPDITDQGGF